MTILDEQAKIIGEILEAHRLHIYQRTEADDVLLLRLWLTLREIGDLPKLAPAHQSLARFMSLHQPPDVVIYSLEDDRINACIRMQPFERACLFSGWFDSAIRHGHLRQVEIMRAVGDIGLQIFNVVVGISQHQSVIRFLAKYDFVTSGVIPFLFGDDAVYTIVHHTRDTWESYKRR